jgi:hypothetical protein
MVGDSPLLRIGLPDMAVKVANFEPTPVKKNV